MNAITHWMDPGLITALGWALLHSLWQGAAIALLLALALILARRQSSNMRYWLAASAMAALLLAFVGTLAWMYEPVPERAVSTFAQEASPFLTDTQVGLPAGPSLAREEAPLSSHPTVFLNYFERHLPLFVIGWLLGVLLLCLRLLGEVAYIQHLRHYRCRKPEGAWLEKLALLQKQLGIRRNVGLLETRRIHSPMVAGVFKQVILLPVGLLSGLPTEQVEAVLAHELAHVRRNDYLANLLFSLVEILLFFNPMMWWISRKAKAEREHACDDLTLELTGDALTLARSLALLEEWRLHGSSLALAFTGRDGSVLSRVQRLLQRDDKRQVAAKTFWVLSIACVCLALLAFQIRGAQPGPANAEQWIKSTVELPEGDDFSALQAPGPELPEEAVGSAAEPKVLHIPEPVTHPLGSDTIPDEAIKIEKQMRQLQEEMQALDLERRKKEQAMRSQELQIRKEMQQAIHSKQKAQMELDIQSRNIQYEREAMENELEMAEHELESTQMELEEKQYALQQQEAQLERAQGEELKQKLKAFQEAQRKLMEEQKNLELRRFEAIKKQRQQAFEKEKALRELENQRSFLEQEQQMMEQDMEFRLMNLHHEVEQSQVDLQIKEREIHARHRELEIRLVELMDKEKK